MLAALGRRPTDGWATTAALAGLVGRLTPIIARWARTGMPRAEVEAAEADLTAECLSVLIDRAGRGVDTVDPGSVVQAGWHRVHGARRTEHAQASRQWPLNVITERPSRTDIDRYPKSYGTAVPAIEQVVAVLSWALAAGVVSRVGAVTLAWQAAGWTSREIAARTGIAAATVRARQSRAARHLAAAAAGHDLAGLPDLAGLGAW